jgi:hypothetical protein
MREINGIDYEAYSTREFGLGPSPQSRKLRGIVTRVLLSSTGALAVIRSTAGEYFVVDDPTLRPADRVSFRRSYGLLVALPSGEKLPRAIDATVC